MYLLRLSDSIPSFTLSKRARFGKIFMAAQMLVNLLSISANTDLLTCRAFLDIYHLSSIRSGLPPNRAVSDSPSVLS